MEGERHQIDSLRGSSPTRKLSVAEVAQERHLKMALRIVARQPACGVAKPVAPVARRLVGEPEGTQSEVVKGHLMPRDRTLPQSEVITAI